MPDDLNGALKSGGKSSKEVLAEAKGDRTKYEEKCRSIKSRQGSGKKLGPKMGG